MKHIIRNIFILILIVIFILAFSSSYSSLSMDNLAYVLAIGIDTSDDNKLEVSFQFTTPVSPESGSTEKPTPIINTVTASSLSNAINLVNVYLGKQVNMSHCKAIIFSEDLSSQGISKHVYTLINDTQVRPSANIVVSKSSAKYYLEQTILEIYQENKLIESFDNLIDKNLILPNKEKTLQIFLNLKLKDVIDYYINSKQYVKDYLHIYKREGEKFATLFDFISSIFIQYYIKSKGNKPKKIRKEKNFDIKSIFSRNNETQKNKIFKIEKLMKHKLLFPSTNNLNNITIYGKNNSM